VVQQRFGLRSGIVRTGSCWQLCATYRQNATHIVLPGSPKASTRPSCKAPRRCSMSWRDTSDRRLRQGAGIGALPVLRRDRFVNDLSRLHNLGNFGGRGRPRSRKPNALDQIVDVLRVSLLIRCIVLPFLIAAAARGTEQNGYVRRPQSFSLLSQHKH
jgi:hypothetical protein